MKTLTRSQIRSMVVKEYYRTSLIEQLYEQAAPTPPDPAAPAAAPETPADPAAADPAAAAAPPAAPAAPGAPAADPAAADPAAAGAPPAIPGAPAADPAAAAAPPVPGAPPATPAPAGAPAAANAAKKSAEKPDPEKDPVKTQINKALIKATSAAEEEEGKVATESLRRRSMRFLLEQSAESPKINMEIYTDEIARLIKNYTSLIDVKKNVIDQAKQYLEDNFPENAKDLMGKLDNLLRQKYSITLKRPEPPSDSYAIGAKSGGGAA